MKRRIGVHGKGDNVEQICIVYVGGFSLIGRCDLKIFTVRRDIILSEIRSWAKRKS